MDEVSLPLAYLERIVGGAGDGGDGDVAAKRWRRASADVEAEEGVMDFGFERLEGAPKPAVGQRPVRVGRLPDGHRAEMAVVLPGVADALDDGETAFAVQRMEALERGVEPEAAVDRQDGLLGEGERRACCAVAGIAHGHERVESVVAAGHLYDDERLPRKLRDDIAWMLGGEGDRPLEERVR